MSDINVLYDTESGRPCFYVSSLEMLISDGRSHVAEDALNTILDNYASQLGDINKRVRDTVYKLDTTSLKNAVASSGALANDFRSFMKICDDYAQIASVKIEGVGVEDTRIEELSRIVENHRKILYKLLRDVGSTYRNLFEEIERQYSLLDNNAKSHVFEVVNLSLKTGGAHPLNEGLLDSVVSVASKASSIVSSFVSSVIKHWAISIGVFIGGYAFLSSMNWLTAVLDALAPVYRIILSIPLSVVGCFAVFVAVVSIMWIYRKMRDTRNENIMYPINKRLNDIEMRRREGKLEDNIDKNNITSQEPNKTENVFRGFGNTKGYVPEGFSQTGILP